MKKKITMIFAVALLLSGIGTAYAAPSSGYTDFLQSLDSIMAGAVLPVADEEIIKPKLAGQQNSQANQILAVAQNMLGKPVVWGGASPAQGFDCSGLVQYVYRQAGIELPRTADIQFQVGRPVAKTALQPGDLVYFTTYEPGASHVGIYIGRDKFIHTSFSKGIVAIADINEDYFVKRYYGAKRVL